MVDLDDYELNRAEMAARLTAEDLIRRVYPFTAYPRKDSLGVVRHGYGRPIEKRPMTTRVADLALREELIRTSAVLRGRVFELKATHPEVPDGRIAVLYAIADILGPEETRDWSPLWEALRRLDWPQVVQELLTCHLFKLMSETPDHKRSVSELIVMLLTGDIPDAGALRESH